MRKINYRAVHSKIFYLVVVFIPLNLGKHFVYSGSYVGGILVDYLVPAIFVTDILILLLLLFWIIDNGFKGILKVLHKSSYVGTLTILLISTFALSTISSISPYSSIHYLIRILLYFGFFMYVISTLGVLHSPKKIVYFVSFSALFLCILGLFQWVGQGSVFDNYLIFGEQPYSASTKGIAIENVFGEGKVPVYGTFRHPNVFAGYLSLVLIWILWLLRKSNILFLLILLILSTLFLTFSQIAWLATLVGLAYLVLFKKFNNRINYLFIPFVLIILLLGLGLPYLQTELIESYPSLYRRRNLGASSLKIIEEYKLFGTGPNTNTVLIEEHLPLTKDLRFVQPAHNIFVLIYAESGLFALTLFCLLFVLAIYKSHKNNQFIIASLCQILILGSFDHYLLTSNQGLLLLWLTLGLALTYNHVDYECEN